MPLMVKLFSDDVNGTLPLENEKVKELIERGKRCCYMTCVLVKHWEGRWTELTEEDLEAVADTDFPAVCFYKQELRKPRSKLMLFSLLTQEGRVHPRSILKRG
jgi:hypothetical protein